MSLNTSSREPVLWQGGCDVSVERGLRLRFETPPSRVLQNLFWRCARNAIIVLGAAQVTAHALHVLWISIAGNIAALLVFSVPWIAECVSARRAGRTRRVERYALTPSRLVFVASDIGGTQTWTLRKSDFSGIVRPRVSLPDTWVSGQWRDPDGVLAHASVALRGIHQSAADQIEWALRR